MKKEYRWVIEALEVANHSLDRAATGGEVHDALSEAQREGLDDCYSDKPKKSVSRLLGRLHRNGRIGSPGKQSGRRYYVSPDLSWEDRDQKALFPPPTSARGRTRVLIRELAENLRRAVRMQDILNYATGEEVRWTLERRAVRRSVHSLVETDELKVIGEVKGDGGGRNLYLPADLDPASYRPDGALTWLEQVKAVVESLWEERRSRPMSTGDVRSAFRDEYPDHERLENPQLLVNALRQLARTDAPYLRTVEREGNFRNHLWAPAAVPDEELELGGTWTSDAERVEEAVRRAIARTGLPAVGLEPIREEIEKDPALGLQGKQPLHTVLGDVSKRRVDDGTGSRRQRRDQRVWKVGKVEGDARYCVDRPDVARTFVEYQTLRSKWGALEAERRLQSLDQCRIESVAAGRALLVRDQCISLQEEIRSLAEVELPDNWELQRLQLKEVIETTAEQAEALLTNFDCTQVPDEVRRPETGWTAEELLDVLRPVYPAAEDATPSDLITLLSRKVRRIPNPDFTSRRSGEHRTASEYLFEQTDALLVAALSWGNTEARVQATVAKNELGRLRDPRWVKPGLTDSNPAVRFAAIACLAFLLHRASVEALEDFSKNTNDEEFLRAADWAKQWLRSNAGGKADTGRPKTNSQRAVEVGHHNEGGSG